MKKVVFLFIAICLISTPSLTYADIIYFTIQGNFSRISGFPNPFGVGSKSASATIKLTMDTNRAPISLNVTDDLTSATHCFESMSLKLKGTNIDGVYNSIWGNSQIENHFTTSSVLTDVFHAFPFFTLPDAHKYALPIRFDLPKSFWDDNESIPVPKPINQDDLSYASSIGIPGAWVNIVQNDNFPEDLGTICYRLSNITVDSKVVPSDLGTGNKGYVVTIDGLHPKGFIDDVSYKTHYLIDAIDALKEAVGVDWTEYIQTRIGKIYGYEWTRDIGDTDVAVDNLEVELKILSQECQKNKAPMVVLSHSWGTVLAYIAISRNSDIVVDHFITLGSPLNANFIIFDSYTELYLKSYKVYPVKRPPNVKQWSNFWARCDLISGAIDDKQIYNEKIKTDIRDNTLTECHSEYFKDPNDWQDILLEVYKTKIPK